ncbi:MAG: MobF family relaxase [Acidimicrobiales bacterium]
MLSVAKLARGREEYYLATLALGREDAVGLIEPDGRWLGRAAEMLGLSGSVDGPALRALLAGVDPVSGEVLSAHHDRVRVVAYDCTYSTPKSVSVLHALGPQEVREHVRAGHEEAAAAALGYLEHCAARVRRRSGPGEQALSVPAGGFVAAAFLHRTSRAPDPHLHSHVLVANLAPGPDSRWSALDGRGLYLELGTARDLYETQLRAELTARLGVSWRQLQGSWAELAGIDPNVTRAFSRRSGDIEAALEQSGRSGPKARRIASMSTRPAKDLSTPYEELVSRWRERSYHLGVSEARLASVAGRSQGVTSRATSAAGSTGLQDGASSETRALLASEGIAAERWAEQALGEHGVVARDGTCRRGELVRSRCASLGLGSPVAEIEGDVEALLAQGRLVPVPEPGRPSSRLLKAASGRSIPGGIAEPLYTTPQILEMHERLQHLVSSHPGTVQLLSYRSGRRLEALDSLAGLLSDPATQVRAVAPGYAAGASFEAVTGIETVSMADLARGAIAEHGQKGVVVLAEAQRLGPWELSSLVESSVREGGRVVVFASEASLEARFGTASAPLMARSGPRRQRSTAPVRRAGRCTVLQVATSLWCQTGSWLARPWSWHGVRRRRPAGARSWWRATTPLCTRCATLYKVLAARATMWSSRGVWQRFFPGSDRIRASRAGSSYSAACRAESKTPACPTVSMSPSSRRTSPRSIAWGGRQRWRGRDISSASLGQSLGIPRAGRHGARVRL